MRRDQAEPTGSMAARVSASGAPAVTAMLVGGALLFLAAVRMGFRGAVVKV